MKKSAVIFSSAVFLLAFALIAESQAELYQYTDKNGVLVITDKKPDSKSRVRTFKDTGKADGQAGQETKAEEKAKRQEQARQQAAAPEAKKTDPDAQKKRDAEADRLEAEARKPATYTAEKRKEQQDMLNRAELLRRGFDPL
ncbi:MAG: DUF4124 domain-containing protein [Syntrophaceae bacterium]